MRVCVGDGLNIKINNMTAPRYGGEENFIIHERESIGRQRHL